MDIDFDNIDTRINILFNFAYNKKEDEFVYTFRRSNLNKINIIDIKMTDDYKWNKLLKGMKFIKQIGDKYIYKRYSESSYPTHIEVGFHQENHNSFDNPINIHRYLAYILSEFAALYKFRMIIFPILNFDVSYHKIKDTPIGKTITESQNKRDMVYFNVSEHFFKINTLTDHIKRNEINNTNLVNILAQVLYILHKIQEEYPTFRHNNLTTNHIYVCYKENSNTKERFTNNNKIMELDISAIECKIYDFYNGSIRNVIGKPNLDNKFYDIHTFLQSLYILLKDTSKLTPEYNDFYSSIIPEQYRSNKLNETEYIKNHDIMTPNEILFKNNFFVKLIIESNMSDSSEEYKMPRESSVIESDMFSRHVRIARVASGTRRLNNPRSHELEGGGKHRHKKAKQLESETIGRVSELSVTPASVHRDTSVDYMKMLKKALSEKNFKVNDDDDEVDDDGAGFKRPKAPKIDLPDGVVPSDMLDALPNPDSITNKLPSEGVLFPPGITTMPVPLSGALPMSSITQMTPQQMGYPYPPYMMGQPNTDGTVISSNFEGPAVIGAQNTLPIENMANVNTAMDMLLMKASEPGSANQQMPPYGMPMVHNLYGPPGLNYSMSPMNIQGLTGGSKKKED